jgi:hypothetical protein
MTDSKRCGSIVVKLTTGSITNYVPISLSAGSEAVLLLRLHVGYLGQSCLVLGSATLLGACLEVALSHERSQIFGHSGGNELIDGNACREPGSFKRLCNELGSLRLTALVARLRSI